MPDIKHSSKNTLEIGSDAPVLEEKSQPMKKPVMLTVAVLLIAALCGAGTGFGFYRLNNKPLSAESAAILEETPTSDIKVGDVYGSPNEEIFKDSAEGVLKAGGLEGEGTHHLIRPGGVSQTVYLTSTVADLDKFVGARIKVWGETNTAQKAGWLMDIGRIKVLELNAPVPEDSEGDVEGATDSKKDTKTEVKTPTKAPTKASAKATTAPKATEKPDGEEEE